VLPDQAKATLCTPVPDKLTDCGLPVAESAMLRLAARAPLANGVNDTAMLQLAPAARELPQVSFSVKSAEFAPERVRPEMLTALPPVLVRVTVWGELVVSMGSLEKLRLPGERVTLAAPLAPVPVRLTVWVLTLLAMETEAVRVPLAAGVKVTLMVQLAPAATLDPQELVWANAPAFVPVTLMLEMVKAALPVLLTVTAWAVLVVERDWLPNARLRGETLMPAAAPVPDRLTV
jgi:hypothetical protein